MVKERMDLLELLRKGGMDGDVDFLREALRVLVEGIMDAEVSSRIGAEYGERSPERVTQRNGYRSRAWDTRVGTMDLHIPKLREGSYFPSLLEPRRRSERALLAVIQQAYVEGVSTRRVDDLVKALGCEGISKSQVSRICQELDVVVDGFMGLPLGERPLLQELPEVRHVPLDLLGGRKLNPPLLKLGLGVLSRSLQLLLTVPQREDSGRQDLQRELARFKGLVEPLKTLPHVP